MAAIVLCSFRLMFLCISPARLAFVNERQNNTSYLSLTVNLQYDISYENR